jgi:putative ABC transport system permease protein
MSYALATLWYERSRFLPGVLAVAFSALLIALQSGLLLGLFSITSLPIDQTRADIWVGHTEVVSVDLGRPIPASWVSYLSMPEIDRTEMFMEGFCYWADREGKAQLCIVLGSRLIGEPLGALKVLTKRQRRLLTEKGAVIVDKSEFTRLGIKGVGDTAEVTGQRVRVVDAVEGIKSLAGPYIFCSLETARPLLRQSEDETTYILATCRNKADAPKVVRRLREKYGNPDSQYGNRISAFTAPEFSRQTQLHWLLTTKAGIALGCAAALGLLVGAVVTSQTLYAATVASLREYAVLRALGIPRWRMAGAVLAQSFWVGLAGLALAIPSALGLMELANALGTKVTLPVWLLALASAVTMVMALLSGLFALRSLRHVEPVALLR